MTDFKQLIKVVHPLGVWLDHAEVKNNVESLRKEKILTFDGYSYRKEASFPTTINWICVKNDAKMKNGQTCTARCITRTDGCIKLGKTRHNH